MSFCWFTSFIGYPNFFHAKGRGADLARAFVTLGDAADAGTPYADSKKLFPHLDRAQVETKKAAFQEFGLLYVVPRSNTLTLTPVGQQVLRFAKDRKQIEKYRRPILLALARGLARYQFNNPLPVGGNREEMRKRAASSDVLPYLACFYLLHKLGGMLGVNELRGAVFALQRMADLHALEESIRKRRASGTPFTDIPGLPAKAETANNLKIYFASHLSLDNEIMTLSQSSPLYDDQEQVYELTQLGFEITESVLSTEWSAWRDKTCTVPKARKFESVESYFTEGVGQACPDQVIANDLARAAQLSRQVRSLALEEEELEGLKELPHREYKEGRQRLVEHRRLEKTRNPALVRDAKKAFKKKHGRPFCEACAFDFEKKYGKRGKDYIEAHHKPPISQMAEVVTLRVEDLAMVCSNCHRMLHRVPWITVEQLKELVTQ
jgi:hypothetical protein